MDSWDSYGRVYCKSALNAVGSHVASFYMQVVNYLLRGWIKNLESQGSVALPLLDDLDTIQHTAAKDLEFVRDGTKRSVEVRFIRSTSLLWNRISSFIGSHVGKLKLKS